MKLVKVLETFLVSSTGVTYTKGQEVEVSEDLAKRHGKDGTGFLQLVKAIKPISEVENK